MSKTKSDDNSARRILDAMPVPIFVVDEDVRVLDANRAGAAVLGSNPQEFLRKRGGEVLHCLHDNQTPAGCGHSEYCKDCVLRNGVRAALEGQPVNRWKTEMELIKDGTTRNVVFWVTTAPFQFAGRPAALLVLEDVTELIELRQLIPICARCKKIRDDRQYWHRLEKYLQEHLNLVFTHGLCPDCLKESLSKIPLARAQKAGAESPPLG